MLFKKKNPSLVKTKLFIVCWNSERDGWRDGTGRDTFSFLFLSPIQFEALIRAVYVDHPVALGLVSSWSAFITLCVKWNARGLLSKSQHCGLTGHMVSVREEVCVCAWGCVDLMISVCTRSDYRVMKSPRCSRKHDPVASSPPFRHTHTHSLFQEQPAPRTFSIFPHTHVLRPSPHSVYN